jgi:hypothetical protein
LVITISIGFNLIIYSTVQDSIGKGFDAAQTEIDYTKVMHNRSEAAKNRASVCVFVIM